jgi:hypothetical protein
MVIATHGHCEVYGGLPSGWYTWQQSRILGGHPAESLFDGLMPVPCQDTCSGKRQKGEGFWGKLDTFRICVPE